MNYKYAAAFATFKGSEETASLSQWNCCAGENPIPMTTTMCNASLSRRSDSDDGDQSTWSRDGDSDFSPETPGM